MEFQFHITVREFKLDDKEKFIKLCEDERVKPLLIVLNKGNHIDQPMFTKNVESNDFNEANEEIEAIVKRLHENGFEIVRKKVEVSPKQESYFNNPLNKNSKPYFEWHGKVKIYDIPMVEKLCKDLGGHISRNSLDEQGKVRFITVREYESKEKFHERVEKLVFILNENSIEMIKEKYELCIYDNKEELDSGWVS